jgi:hypothetical protein
LNDCLAGRHCCRAIAAGEEHCIDMCLREF